LPFTLAVLPMRSVIAQDVPGCAAYDHPTQWADETGSSIDAPTRSRIVELLEGTYTLYTIATEGTEKPFISKRRIRVVRADSGAGMPVNRVMVGTRIDVARPTPQDSLRRGRFLNSEDFEMRVDSAGDLRWNTSPGVLDAGVYFRVSTVDSTGFSGRWIDGSIAVLVFRRGPLMVAETTRGYYCALRER
jgi:hypothetical protein